MQYLTLITRLHRPNNMTQSLFFSTFCSTAHYLLFVLHFLFSPHWAMHTLRSKQYSDSEPRAPFLFFFSLLSMRNDLNLLSSQSFIFLIRKHLSFFSFLPSMSILSSNLHEHNFIFVRFIPLFTHEAAEAENHSFVQRKPWHRESPPLLCSLTCCLTNWHLTGCSPLHIKRDFERSLIRIKVVLDDANEKQAGRSPLKICDVEILKYSLSLSLSLSLSPISWVECSIRHLTQTMDDLEPEQGFSLGKLSWARVPKIITSSSSLVQFKWAELGQTLLARARLVYSLTCY
jgi:hypothetical protein